MTFGDGGTIERVEELLGEPGEDWTIVTAETEDQARVKALRRYFARKKRERIAKLHEEGKCRCGRLQDRPGKLTCTVCAHDRQQQHEKAKARGFEPAPPRDEGARVESMRETLRERRESYRLEVLLDVRRWWKEAEHTEAFARKLAEEILAAGGTTTQTSTPTAKLAS